MRTSTIAVRSTYSLYTDSEFNNLHACARNTRGLLASLAAEKVQNPFGSAGSK